MPASGRHLEVLNRLLECGADPNAADARGENALMRAANCGYLPMVDSLLECAAPIRTLWVTKGRTPCC